MEELVRYELEKNKYINNVNAIKIVRGGYMSEERARAVKYGYEDPINSTIEETKL